MWAPLLAFSVTSPMVAELIGYVEYHLPVTEHGWRLSQPARKTDKKSTVHIYIPNYVGRGQLAPEYFAATYVKSQGASHDIQSLIKAFKNQFPQDVVNVHIVETTQNSVIYEWSIGEKGKEKMAGWFRIFSTTEGTVSLGYLTHAPQPDIEKLRALWLPVLKGAKIAKLP